MNIALIYRKRNPLYFSLEKVFDITFRELIKYISVKKIAVPDAGVKLSNLIFLRKKSKEERRDCIFHVTGDIHYAVFALPRKRTILTIHDCNFLENYSGVKKMFLKKILLDWPVKYVRVVTVISEKTKFEILANTKCDPDKIVVVNNPNTPGIYDSGKQFCEQYPVLLFIGSTLNKNLERAIEAIRGLQCRLNIVGQPTPNQLMKLAEFGIDYVIEKGLSDDELAKRYADADIVFFPTLYEGFGLPIIEGFKAGKPVLTSNLPPMKDVAHGAAWLVNPYDISSIREGLSNIISDRKKREENRIKGLKLAEQYEPEIIAKKYIDIYKTVLA